MEITKGMKEADEAFERLKKYQGKTIVACVKKVSVSKKSQRVQCYAIVNNELIWITGAIALYHGLNLNNDGMLVRGNEKHEVWNILELINEQAKHIDNYENLLLKRPYQII